MLPGSQDLPISSLPNKVPTVCKMIIYLCGSNGNQENIISYYFPPEQQEQLTVVEHMHWILFILSSSHAVVHLTLITTLANRYCYCLQFTEEETEAQSS